MASQPAQPGACLSASVGDGFPDQFGNMVAPSSGSMTARKSGRNGPDAPRRRLAELSELGNPPLLRVCEVALGGSGGDVGEQVVDDEGWPQDGFDDGPHVSPESGGVLPVVDKSSDESQAVDGAATAAPHDGRCLRGS